MRIDYKYVEKYNTVSDEERNKLTLIKEKIFKKESMLDWIDQNTTLSDDEMINVVSTYNKIKEYCDTLVIIATGGSLTGTKAIYDALKPYYDYLDIELVFLGYTFDLEYLEETLEYLDDKEVCVNVISKSGNTMEIRYTYDRVYEYMKSRYDDYQDRFIFTTGSSGILRNIAQENGYMILNVPDNVGGRFSTFSSVGIFPLMCAGIDTNKLICGVVDNRECFYEAARLALVRLHLEEDNKYIDAVTFYKEKLVSLGKFYQQVFAETQGKRNRGILPIINLNSCNLHSIGQYFADGKKMIFQTVICEENDDSLNGKVIEPVACAFSDVDNPSIIIYLPKIDEYNLGKLIYFLQMTSVVGGYLMDINPLDQPGVEGYKNNIKDLY